MIRHATIFWVAVAGMFLTALTIVGSEVRDRDHALAELHAAIGEEQERIHVLRAERAYLSSPDRIAARAEQELGLAEIGADRIRTIASLPRYVPAPDLELQPEDSAPLLLSRLPGRSGGPVERLSGWESDVAAFQPLHRRNAAQLVVQTSFMPITAGWSAE